MNLHMRQFDGLTFGMPVDASSPAFKRMKRNTFTRKMKPRGFIHKCPVGSDGVVIDPGILVLTGEVALMTRKMKPRGSCVEQTVHCVQASDVAAVMGEAGWLVRELQCMEMP